MNRILIFCLLCFGISHGQTANTETWKTYKKGNYSIEYPSSWTLNTDGNFGSEFFLFSAKQDENDDFYENISLIKQDLSKSPMTLQEYAALSEEQVKTLVTNYTKVESTETLIGSKTFYHLSYTGDQGVYHLKYDQYYYLKNNKAYVFTYTSKQDSYTEFEAIFSRLVTSFKLK